ncbi:hypothetical protein AA0312_0404 [Acetobacter tropicalis NRIC 0312]|uniref:Uncharacterized protein n=1 Tax=Acetobacter tropicalis TaxID=104102 RepID=A0A511FL88_9PROT|nr:hypothetical protein [Acetobacter tropicalis]GAL97570.1 hypothetical protein ATR1_067d0338 [Acetobacter tropicalis]GBR67384.1 hypothetical protein AA0312_0404 [Acetobacter tropicalis NRIC 0312]GEL49989.1 hypothetical protein ATR01nite_10640 [Acetobacter tropicalis]
MRYQITRHQTGRHGVSRAIHRFRHTRRLSPWDATDEDLQVMAALTERLGAPPVSNMMRYCGPEVWHLDQLGESLGDWRRMLEALARRYPDLPRSGAQASDGTTLDSAPERIVWEKRISLPRWDAMLTPTYLIWPLPPQAEIETVPVLRALV